MIVVVFYLLVTVEEAKRVRETGVVNVWRQGRETMTIEEENGKSGQKRVSRVSAMKGKRKPKTIHSGQVKGRGGGWGVSKRDKG